MNSDKQIKTKDDNNEVDMLISRVKKKGSSSLTNRKANNKQTKMIIIEIAKAIFLFVPLLI
jgi:hypothetical protein